MERLTVWFAFALLAIAADPNSSNASIPAPNASVAAHFNTVNFQVYSAVAKLPANEVAERCEQLRTNLQLEWLALAPQLRWTPACQVVMHADRNSYLAAAGAGAVRTTGCSSIRVENGNVTLRRIDVCGENLEKALSAISHELVHVVLTDRFGEQPLPRWADEGIATLADDIEKQAGHHRDLLQASQTGAHFRVAELMLSAEYPAGTRMAAFYGQSTSLVRFLIQRRPAADFIRLIERSRRDGYDAALRDIYEIDGLAALDQQWRNYLLTASASPQSQENLALHQFDVLVSLAQE